MTFDLEDPEAPSLIGLYFRHVKERRILKAEEEQVLGKELSDARLRLGSGLAELIRLQRSDPSLLSDAPVSIDDPALRVEDPDPQKVRPVLDYLERNPKSATRALRKNLGEALDQIESAKEDLVLANLRLVASVARRYAGNGLLFLDLVQEGNIGLMRAAEKFDLSKGCRFSTYATWWIHQRIRRAIVEQGETIRLPVQRAYLKRKVHRLRESLTRELGRKPLREEVARRGGISPKNLEAIDGYSRGTVALQEPLGEDDGELQDILPDPLLPPPDEQAERREFHEEISRVLSMLPARDARLIRMRYGIGFEREHSLEEIGKALGVSRERIRQIEVQAFRKLRTMTPRGLMALL